MSSRGRWTRWLWRAGGAVGLALVIFFVPIGALVPAWLEKIASPLAVTALVILLGKWLIDTLFYPRWPPPPQQKPK